MSKPESGRWRLDRRATIKWMLAACVSAPRLGGAEAPALAASAQEKAGGYGTDPDLQRTWSPGEPWPLTLPPDLRRTAAALCDVIIPEDDHSPGASAVGVVDFIDEWISAPYPRHREDRDTILSGLEWLDAESERRYSEPFSALGAKRQHMICDNICYLPGAGPDFGEAARFFARYRDLAAGGFYTTPAGMKDLQYVGNVATTRFEGPPDEVLKAAGLQTSNDSPGRGQEG